MCPICSLHKHKNGFEQSGHIVASCINWFPSPQNDHQPQCVALDALANLAKNIRWLFGQNSISRSF